VLALVPFAVLGAAGSAVAAQAAPPEEQAFLRGARQLTFDGRRAGEGYFSADGTHLVFQSEREPANPFFQIYVLDLTSGETRRVSPGTGKTTCAFFRPPGSAEVLFASTHHDPASERLQREELQRRTTGGERRYEWDFDPEMDLYVARAGGPLRRLTDARGYDAEASYSPDGEWIVFTSTRAGYTEDLEEGERSRLDADPSYFADLYRMRSDGSQLRRLTSEPGYDGGPFFFADGERIVWRRFEPDGTIADLWSARPDGSGAERLTEFGSMSWAPYPHPSGRYVVFTSNKEGFGNFELFVVDAQGRKEPVRVTYTDGFDGLPVPSPDGRRLAWTSNRRGAGAQIMIADWNHEQVLAALESAPARRPAREAAP
jgi:Tol biopolymer transport system component